MIGFGVSRGLRGWFAIVYDDSGPIQSGIGSYATEFEAWIEASEWAESEGYPAQAQECYERAYPPRDSQEKSDLRVSRKDVDEGWL